MKKVAIIGAGFTGLSCAYYLSKKGHRVQVFEKDSVPGGLAVGYKEKSWDWTLERHYHHWFTNDKSVLDLAREIDHKVIIPRPKTSSFVDGKIYQLDSPISLLKFPKLSLSDRIRMGISLGVLKYNPFWKPLEKYKAESYLQKSMGEKGYNLLWKPLLCNKLGKYSNAVSLAWFWARIYKRTPKLVYPEGGFLNFAQHLQHEIEKRGGKFYYDTEVVELSSRESPEIKFKQARSQKLEARSYDAIIVTLPSLFFTKIADLPEDYKKKLGNLKGIGALNLILRLEEQFITDNTYWLSICDEKSPILAVVEHTNFMDKKHYDDEHIVYLGNYMETKDSRFSMNEKELLDLYDPWLKKINPNYRSSIIDYRLFKAPFAQPIITTNYSKKIPPFLTPLKNVYLANIEQVYPWDRGTNYAVELGRKMSKLLIDEN